MEVILNGMAFAIVLLDGEDPKMHPDRETYNLGLTEYLERTINIRKGMDDAILRQTVIHELVHASIFAYGYTVDDEESMCDFFGAQADNIMKLTDEIVKGVKDCGSDGSAD